MFSHSSQEYIKPDLPFLQRATSHHCGSLRSMSDHGAPPSGQYSSWSPTPKMSRPSLNYEFVDSQDPNTKSQIQRHTAQHAVQQRREAARQRLLRENRTPRVFEWQRRSDAETDSLTTSPSITGSLSALPPTEVPVATAPTTRSSISSERIREDDLRSSPNEQLSTVTMAYSDVEEALLKYCKLFPDVVWAGALF
jgi:hypothetical protein